MTLRQRIASILCILLWTTICQPVRGQEVGIKTNLLYDATTTLNLGVEVGLSRHWSLDISGSLNPWKFKDDKQFRIWMAQPEARYWFCEQMSGHFIGVHAMGGQFEASGVKLPFGLVKALKDSRYQGWYAGAGFVYGYQWVMARHWNFEAAVGVGYDYLNWTKYKCGKCGTKEKSGHTNYFGITKLALALIYVF